MLRDTEALLRNHFCRGKAINITYSECMPVALVIQHEKRMSLLSSMVCLAQPYFFTSCHKMCDFRENVIECKICVLSLSITFI
jgi:hypothetical protein